MSSPEQPKRTVPAPDPIPNSAAGARPTDRVLSVDLGEREEVEWTWTTSPDGQSYVSGYTVRTRLPKVWTE